MDPIINKNIEILILGTYPGELSLERGEYYADPRNKFWSLISLATGEDFEVMSYDKKKNNLLKHGIGIWDVFKSVNREGGADRNINVDMAVFNDFIKLRQNCLKLKAVYFNGRKAEEFGKNIIKELEIETGILLSSSGANNGYLEERRRQWKNLFKK
jgi:G:T/U mismatch-specific DNA glycosylase